MLAVIAIVVGARAILTPAPPFADLGTAASPPPYYVSVDWNDRIVVHATATGRMTAATSQPRWLSGGNFHDAAITQAADGRTFVVALNDWDSLRTRLYRFSLTSAGQIADFAAIPGRHLPGLTGISAAVSPDGLQLALAGNPDQSPGGLWSAPPRLFVVNLKTGSLRRWDGLAKTGDTDEIFDPSWTSNESLQFFVESCAAGRTADLGTVCPQGQPRGQEWTVPVRRASGSLTGGRILASLPVGTIQAVSGPHDTLTLLSMTGDFRASYLVLRRYVVASGRLAAMLYRSRAIYDSGDAYLSADLSGRYVIVNEDRSAVFGWVGDGKIQHLAVRGPVGFDELLATAW